MWTMIDGKHKTFVAFILDINFHMVPLESIGYRSKKAGKRFLALYRNIKQKRVS